MELARGDERDDRLGPFELLEPLGRGSLARVFVARHVDSGETLALKWIDAPDSVPRLKREFRVARALRHPNLVRLHELHELPEGTFFTMEQVTGPDVVGRCARETDPKARVALARGLFAQLADALAYLHAGGLVHGDLKPANVLIGDGDRPVLVDFELAQRVAPHRASGRFSGTYAYAAPELLHGGPPSAPSDWFAFGVLFFEALVGRLPFGGDPAKTTTAWFNSRRVESLPSLPEPARDLAPLLDGLMSPVARERAGAPEVFAVLGSPRRWVRAPVLIERAAAAQRLREALERPCARVVVSGAPGLGKTRMVQQVLAELGLPLLTGVCHPREHVALNALDGPSHQLAAWARTASRTELAAALEETLAEGDLGTLAAAFVTGARELSQGPLVLCVDGAQWADSDSAALLTRIRTMADAVALDLRVVATSSEEPAQLPEPFRPPDEHAIRLPPLTGEGSEALLKAVAPAMVGELRAHLVTLCGGNPLLLERAALWFRERGPEHPWPRSAAELSLSTSPRASGAQRALLELLAVHGSPLDSEVLAACPGLTMATACDLLEEGLVQMELAKERRWVRFCHQRSAAALLEELAPAAVRAHHRMLAEAFGRAMPGEADARFMHWVAAGERDRARTVALESARQLTRRLAFHRAAERYRWLLEHGDATTEHSLVQRELAEVLARQGDAIEAAQIYETLAEEGERNRFERAAAEQWLRAGEVERGRALLRRCLERAGAELPSTAAGCVRALLGARKEIRALSLEPPRRSPDPATDAAMELAWTAGLGLNLVHLAESAVAQVRFTRLALREGRPDQVGRALGVEYSYAMLTGSPGARAHGQRLRDAMARVGREVAPATRAMMDLSTGAGDFFRGELEGAERQLSDARERYATLLGARSWERANCEMYASWVALERGELEAIAARVPAQAELARERGDLLYRQCFHRGFGATAWLVRDEPERLRGELDALALPPDGFQLPHFLDLIARVRLDLYEGADGWRRFARAWPSLRSSGQWLFRWPRYAIARLAVQAAIGSGRPREARRWIRRLLLTGHPCARSWATLATGLVEERFRLVERARDLFERRGMTLGAMAAEHHLLGTEWSGARTSALVRAAAMGPPD